MFETSNQSMHDFSRIKVKPSFTIRQSNKLYVAAMIFLLWTKGFFFLSRPGWSDHRRDGRVQPKWWLKLIELDLIIMNHG